LEKKYPDDNPFNKKKIGDEIIPFIERINNPIVQSHYIKKLAEFLNVSESSIQVLLKRLRQKKKEGSMFISIKKEHDEKSREIILQRYVLSVVFQNENPYSIAKNIFKVINPHDFSLGSYQKICQKFIEFMETHPDRFDITQFTRMLSSELQPVFDEIYLFASSELGFESEHMYKLAYDTKRFSLKRAIKTILSDEQQEDSLAKEKLKKLTSELKEVEKKALSL